MDNNTLKSWGLALFSVIFLWGINNVLLGVGAKVMDGNAIIYSCTAFTTGALALLLYAGPGKLANETMRSIDTWVYGITLLIGYSLSFVLYTYVSSTEGTLLQRFSVIISLLISWFLLSRKPSKGQLFGAVLIITGIILIIRDIPSDIRMVVYVVMILFAFFQAARIFAAEYHRPHIAATQEKTQSPKAKARVVGFVMFMVSTAFAFLTFLFAVAQSSVNPEDAIKGLPLLSDFFNTGNILLGLGAGALILAPLLLIEFRASHDIKTENYLAVTALAAMSTWFWEWATAPIFGLSLQSFSNEDIVACTLITIGGLSMALLKMNEKVNVADVSEYLDTAPQELEMISDSREIIANTIEHFGGNINKTSTALDLPKEVVNALLNDSKKVLAFNPKALNNVARNYRNKVAMCDALTGLTNRAGFTKSLKNAPQEMDAFAVLYIDLDKFKPVNDTYGHDVGDAVLRGVADRLNGLFPRKAVVARLGGDEFCVILLGVGRIEAQQRAIDIQETMSEPFILLRERVAIGASVGVAVFPEDGTDPDKLMKLADGSMYEKKTGSER